MADNPGKNSPTITTTAKMLPDFASGNTGPGNVPDENQEVPNSTLTGAGTQPPVSGRGMQSRELSQRGYTGAGRTAGSPGKSSPGVTQAAPIQDFVESTSGAGPGSYA